MLKALNIWLPGYLRRTPCPAVTGTTDIMLCLCDHFEPLHNATVPEALQRVAKWAQNYPSIGGPFTDADGIPPRYTFFYPIEKYHRAIIDRLTTLTHSGQTEIELHLHHDRDTAEKLRHRLVEACARFVEHGLLCRDPSGRIRYGFVHGNWALGNSDPKRLNCGVDNELDILTETGCYADFTMPSAPHPAQTHTINSIYYATPGPGPKSHDFGTHSCLKPVPPPSTLLLVQGPLGLNWQRRKWNIFPRIENAELSGSNPPTPDRMRLWLELGGRVTGRPEWVFIKLHTHGCDIENGTMDMLLGEPMRAFHRYLEENHNDGQKHRLHYVTARELVNIVHAAEDGHSGNPGQFRNYRYTLQQ